MSIRLTNVDARIILACKRPKRPIELLRQFGTDISYSYLNQRLSVLAALGVLVRKNLRSRGKNASWYTISDNSYLMEAEKVLNNDTDLITPLPPSAKDTKVD